MSLASATGSSTHTDRRGLWRSRCVDRLVVATKMLLRRASRRVGGRPAFAHPPDISASATQTQSVQKFARDRRPAAGAAGDPGRERCDRVMTIGGCGAWYGFDDAALPGVEVHRAAGRYLPVAALQLVQAPRRPQRHTWSIASTNIAVRSRSRLPNASASDIRPPGLIPNRKRPSSKWSIIAT